MRVQPTRTVLLPFLAAAIMSGQATSPVALVTGFKAGTARNDFSGKVGMRFRAGAGPVVVTMLGRLMIDGNTASHGIELLDSETGKPLGAVNVSMVGGVPGQFQYAALASPVTLKPGAVYDLVTAEVNGGDRWLDSDTVVATRPEAAVLNGVYSTGTGFAVNAILNQMYGPVDFQFTTGSSSSVDTTSSVPFLTALVPGTPRNDADTWVGYRFTVGVEGLSVTALGRFCIPGNKEAHPVKIVDAATGEDVPQASASVQMGCDSAAGFRYAPLPSPVNLPPNASFYLVSLEKSGADTFYDSNTRVAFNRGGTVFNGVYRGTAWVNLVVTEFVYGPPNFLYAASAPAPSNGGLKIMPLGDSMTDGQGGYRTELWQKLAADGRAVDFVGSRSSGPEALPDRDHEGHVGWRSDYVAAGAGWWVPVAKPDVILLLVGANDVLQNYDIENAPNRIADLVDRVIEAAPDAHIFVSTAIPFANPEDNLKIQTLNRSTPEIVASRAAQGKKVYLVDSYGAFTLADIDTDGVHPSVSGFSKLANLWYDAIKAAGL